MQPMGGMQQPIGMQPQPVIQVNVIEEKVDATPKCHFKGCENPKVGTCFFYTACGTGGCQRDYCSEHAGSTNCLITRTRRRHVTYGGHSSYGHRSSIGHHSSFGNHSTFGSHSNFGRHHFHNAGHGGHVGVGHVGTGHIGAGHVGVGHGGGHGGVTHVTYESAGKPPTPCKECYPAARKASNTCWILVVLFMIVPCVIIAVVIPIMFTIGGASANRAVRKSYSSYYYNW